jgi:uracil-DNA glycosylase family 4
MNNRQRIIDDFVERGLKESDVSRATREMFSYYEEISLLYRYVNRKGPVRSTGHMNPEIMVVSDHPQKEEASVGFSGYGKYNIYILLFLQRLGISVRDVFWTQAIKEEVDRVTLRKIREWQPHLYNEIYITRPSVIIALGTTAITALAGDPVKIDQAIGNEFFFTAHKEIPVIPIKHPRLILQNEDIKQDTKQTWRSLKSISDLL